MRIISARSIRSRPANPATASRLAARPRSRTARWCRIKVLDPGRVETRARPARTVDDDERHAGPTPQDRCRRLAPRAMARRTATRPPAGAAEAGQTQPGQSPKVTEAGRGIGESGTSQAGEAPNGEMKSGAVTAGFNRSGTAAAGAMQAGHRHQPALSSRVPPPLPPPHQQAAAQQEQAAFQIQPADQIREAVRNDPALASLEHAQAAGDRRDAGGPAHPTARRGQVRRCSPSDPRRPTTAHGCCCKKWHPCWRIFPRMCPSPGTPTPRPFKRGRQARTGSCRPSAANATRRVLVDATGSATTGSIACRATPIAIRCCRRDPLAAANRRIAIVVLRTTPRAFSETTAAMFAGFRRQPKLRSDVNSAVTLNRS